MENLDFLFSLIEVIEPYNSLDLLSKVGALQLCPENANHAFRFEALAHAINCVKYEPNKPSLTRHRLDRICNEPPLGDSFIQSQEDPTPNAFTEAFTFFGGSYIVFPGQLSDPTFILKHLDTAIFQSEKFKVHKGFLSKVYRMNHSLLVISDTIAKRSGLARNMSPRPLSETIFIPRDIDTQKGVVEFSLRELEDNFGPFGLEYSDLEPFIRPFGQLKIDSYSFQNSPIHFKPIIRFEDKLVVAEPWMLLATLRHHILLAAKKYGVIDLLFEEYQKAVLHTVGFSLNRFGYKQIYYALQETDLQIDIRESLWTLDADKVFYVVVRFDNFTDYSGNDLFKDNINLKEGKWLDKRLMEVEQQVHQANVNLGDIFFLLINVGIGRSQIIALQLNKLEQEPVVLMLSASELETLSLLYDFDSLVLYKFAKAQQAIRESTLVFSWSTLDEFEIYRKNHFSYYFNDGPRPKSIIVAVGEGREIKLEVLQKLDIHAVPYFELDSWIEVMNVYHTPSCPIYSPINFHPKQISFFVELSPMSFWIKSMNQSNYLESNTDIPNPGIFVDLISYWIWQFGKELSRCLADVDLCCPIVIEIGIDETEQWIKKFDLEQDNNLPLSIRIINEFEIQIMVKPAILRLLNTANNFGEIQVMQFILEGLTNLLASYGWIEQSNALESLIPQIIEEQRLFPRKKKLLAIDPNTIPSLLPGNLIEFRKVQEADRSILLDEAGDFLKNELHLQVGNIPKDQYTYILNSIVGFYFTKLSNMVSELSSKYLLDFLVSHYEAIITEKTRRNITITTQLECFSPVQELTQQLVEQLPEIDDAAVSCRFLIEFVVSQPPKGEMPISLAVYDQMMALASEIISRGNQSDFCKYGLFEFDFRLLESGRLGFDRSQFNARVDKFQNSRSIEEIVEAGESFTRWWRERSFVSRENDPQHVKKLDQAFEAEFGIMLTDISRFVSELGDLSVSMDSAQLKKMERSKLVTEMSNTLEWEEKKTLLIINFLSLSPREKFLIPPKPFRKSDIYPWRMNRGLSYIRRPLLFVREDNQTIVCWGVRHLFTSFDYLLNAIVSGRLQDGYKSKEMREFLGRLHSREGEEFNDCVYDEITHLPGVIVDKKVKKVGGIRIGAPHNDLGDLDVFAIFPKKKVLAIIECKDLEIARNAIEMSREVEALFVGNDHSTSTIVKHLRRVNWVKSNLTFVLKSYGIKKIGKWKIEPILVVSKEMITPYFHNAPIPVYAFNRFVSDYLSKHS